MRQIILLGFGLIFLRAMPTFAQDIVVPVDYFVEASVNNPTPFVGQQIIYSFRLFTAVSLPDTPYLPPDFEGFWRTEIGTTAGITEQINGQIYSVAKLDTALYPTRTGELIIPSASVTLPATVFRDEEVLATDAITIQALPLPDGAPEGFGGAVGDFNMQATLDRQSLRLGEPLSLKLTVTGSGNVEQLPPPELPLPSDWRIYPSPTTYRAFAENEILIGEKIFEWLLVPPQPGSQLFPEIVLSYFDPLNLAYRSISTAPITLEILPANEPLTPIMTSAPGPQSLALKPIPASLQSAEMYLGGWFWLLWLLPPAALAGVWWWHHQQMAKQHDRSKSQYSKALQRARASLQMARRAGGSEMAYRRVTDAIFAYFGSKLNDSPVGLSEVDLQEALTKHHISAALIDNLFACLELADRGRYAPIDNPDISSLIERTAKTLAAIDTTWKTE